MLKKLKLQNYDEALKVRDWAIRELLSCTDLDYSELKEIRNNDLDWDSKDIYIRARKQKLHLSTMCIQAIFDYKMYARWVLAKKRRHQYFFVGKDGGAVGLDEVSQALNKKR